MLKAAAPADRNAVDPVVVFKGHSSVVEVRPSSLESCSQNSKS
jgi:hypothetical protein